MKKRILFLVLCLILLMSCACSKRHDNEEVAEPYQQSEESADVKTESKPSKDYEFVELPQQKDEANDDEATVGNNEQSQQQNDNESTFDSSESDGDSKQESQSKQQELFNYEVTAEPFEEMEIRNSYTTYKSFANEQELYDAADMVFIGMPIDTFTDGDMRYYNFENQEIDKDLDEQAFFYCTVRNIKVIEMLKGDKTLDTVAVADRSVVKEDEGGKQIIIGLPSGDHIAKKNVKYVYYVTHALPESMDFYFIAYDEGLINIDGLDSGVGRADRMLAAKERLPEQFEKYDRSTELAVK